MEVDDWSVIPDTAPAKFDSAEHADIPAECFLKFSLDGPALSGKALEGTLFTIHWNIRDRTKLWLTERSGTAFLTFAKSIALAGDFFTDFPIYEPISYGQDFTARKARFETAVGTMRSDPSGIMGYMDKYLTDEAAAIDTIMENLAPKRTEDKAKEEKPEEKTVNQITQNYINEAGKSSLAQRRVSPQR